MEKKGAELSKCRTYRYVLWRKWGNVNSALFIGLNPSTADEINDDLTIKKCVGFAKRWGFGGIYMLNLFAFRATDPIDMIRADEPIGPDNDIALTKYSQKSQIVVACWGSISTQYRPRLCWQTRIGQVQKAIGRTMVCLGKTKDGSPRHPSRLAYNTRLETFHKG